MLPYSISKLPIDPETGNPTTRPSFQEVIKNLDWEIFLPVATAMAQQDNAELSETEVDKSIDITNLAIIIARIFDAWLVPMPDGGAEKNESNMSTQD